MRGGEKRSEGRNEEVGRSEEGVRIHESRSKALGVWQDDLNG